MAFISLLRFHFSMALRPHSVHTLPILTGRTYPADSLSAAGSHRPTKSGAKGRGSFEVSGGGGGGRVYGRRERCGECSQLMMSGISVTGRTAK